MDEDEDGYGDPGDPSCSAGQQTDCNDSDSGVHPGATEIECNDIDEDCNGSDYCPGTCTGAAEASTSGTSSLSRPSDFFKNLAFFLLLPGVAVALSIRKKKREESESLL